jgi:hypothetical protein
LYSEHIRACKKGRDIAEKASHHFKKGSILLNLKPLAILEKASISLKSLQK